MTNFSRTRRSSFDMWPPGPYYFGTDLEVEIFVSELENKLTETNFGDILDNLLPQPNFLALVISGKSIIHVGSHRSYVDSIALRDACPLRRWLADAFPYIVDVAFMDSVLVKLLKQLSLCLQLLPYPFEAETFRTLRDHHRSLEFSLLVLGTIPSMTFSEIPSESLADGENEFEETNFLKVKPKSQRSAKRKRSKRDTMGPVVDVKPFHNLGIAIPTTRCESQKIATDILKDLREILEVWFLSCGVKSQLTITQFYFETLRRPDLGEAIKRAYFPREQSTNGESSGNSTDERSTSCESPSQEKELSVYPMVQPMKAALYFDSADEFGEWRILISTRADRNLREARRTDAKTFKIIIKKIK
jgi:hypothetical protein